MRIRAIYAADAAGRRLPRAERGPFRATHLRPLMDEFFAWAAAARDLTPRPHPRDQGARLRAQPAGRAAPRPRRRRPPLDNTRAERALRKIVVGRKNWLFYGTDTHAEAAAAVFSLLATCRLHELDLFGYLDEVLRVLPSWPRERYLELAPQRWRATRARPRSGRPRAPDRPHRRPALAEAAAASALRRPPLARNPAAYDARASPGHVGFAQRLPSGDFDDYWQFHLAQEHDRVHRSRYADGEVPNPLPRERPRLTVVK
ncbi:MAG: transposase [Kofleriaceae bacterium]|nr:transposase [Kofleriaceae bacterium]